MTAKIEICNLCMTACHGVLPQERVVGNRYRVDVALTLDIAQAIESDLVDDTVSYADAVAVITAEMQRPSALLEHVAGRIVRRLAEAFPRLEAIDLRLAKVAPPIAGADVDECAVSLHYDTRTNH